MGSMVYLSLGSFEVNWGKNNFLMMHGSLFQPSDVSSVPDTYVGDDDQPFTVMQPGASKPLKAVLARLELLGYTLAAAEDDFNSIVKISGTDESPVSFEDLVAALKIMDVDAAATDYHDDYDYGEFFAREIFDRLGLGQKLTDPASSRYELGRVMENLHPYSVLRILAENPRNLERAVQWHYNDVVENGWVDAETIAADIGSVRRFLVVTEGSSDANILRKALDLLRPETADFFTFVDMEEGYPFTGAGNLHRFCQGLCAIGVENQVIAVYDNDLEGAMRCAETKKLKLPPNMRVTMLPTLQDLSLFQAVGPDGVGQADINGKAASIECYLDLSFKTTCEPRVRWSNYVEKAGAYQGSLENKGVYAKKFLGLRGRATNYDFSKLEAVLDHLFEICHSLAESGQFTRPGRELNRDI